MRNIKVGDKLQVHCYKHDGTFRRSCDEATVLEVNEKGIVCANYKTRIVEFDEKDKEHQYFTKEPAILFFYKDEWYNIIAQMKPKGIYYYCNIASPYIIDDGVIKYIDYDLDLRVFPDGAFKVLDRNEYRYHKKIMNYSKDLETIIQHELTSLIEKKKNGQNPFGKFNIDYYYDIYEKIRNRS